ncbi:MAG: DUF5009 domain-containing protein [Thermoleophilia bacterium]|nr:DUF5009 domain-containing protein [Thermoleophilia bacterium]
MTATTDYTRGGGSGAPGRLVSLDAYRGFTMLAMASGGLGLAEMARRRPDEPIWALLASQAEHVPWRGGTAWDLIQPSFMFIVGVAMPFSYAARRARGDAKSTLLGHALWRSFLLVALGVFLTSAWGRRTDFTFTNVLCQIGLGYPIVYLLLDQKPSRQFAAALAILGVYWLAFAAYPVGSVPPSEMPGPPVERFDGFLAHWNKFDNAAAAFDAWFLNLFPRPDGKPFRFNAGGYATLNFLPSAATMLFGAIAGGWLRSGRSVGATARGLVGAGLAGLAVGLVLDATVCPIVKRIWTPSWAIYSAGWTCLLLAAFHVVIDGAGYRRWAAPLMVVGANSIAVYVMAQLMKPFVAKQLAIHLGESTFEGPYAPVVKASAVLLVFWLIAWSMDRRRIYVRN